MSLKTKVVAAGIEGLLAAPKALRPVYAARRRLLAGGQRRVGFYYRADDPYCHLLLQVLPDLASAYGLEVSLIPIGEVGPGAHPEPEMLAAHAIRDARVLAEAYGLEFPLDAALPDADAVRKAHALLLARRPSLVQLALARELGGALWSGDRGALDELSADHDSIDLGSVDRSLDANTARLVRAGHYQSGMLHYEGDWYWGVDRLGWLQERLQEEGLSGPPPATRVPSPTLREQVNRATEAPPRIRVFFSFRSPYSYVVLPQLKRMRDQRCVDLELTPVLPMVMRGLQVPRAKRLYIVHDTNREAERHGIPFGRICDPLGAGINRCFAVFLHCAVPRGLQLEFALSAMQGSWAEARDLTSDTELEFVAQRAGIGPSEVRAALERDDWKDYAAANREALTGLGLWGVPSLQIGAYSTWGQDRLELISEALGCD